MAEVDKVETHAEKIKKGGDKYRDGGQLIEIKASR